MIFISRLKALLDPPQQEIKQKLQDGRGNASESEAIPKWADG